MYVVADKHTRGLNIFWNSKDKYFYDTSNFNNIHYFHIKINEHNGFSMYREPLRKKFQSPQNINLNHIFSFP